MDIQDANYEGISSTALVTSYPRTFTNIPYEKEIYTWLCQHCLEDVSLNKMLAPEIEARYKLINRLLDASSITQVLELAAGYSSRGLIYSKQGYRYVEMDLPKVIQMKNKLLASFESPLHLVSGNALRRSDFSNCFSYFDESKPVAIINEGLLRYLTFDEKRIVAENIYSVLEKYDGVWITSDVTPKKFIQSQDKALPNFNQNLTCITDRNSLNDRFENIEHVQQFFGDIGFELVEVHPFAEMLDELSSIHTYHLINEQIEQTLRDAIVVIMRIKR